MVNAVSKLATESKVSIWERFSVDKWGYREIAAAHRVTPWVVGRIVKQFKAVPDWAGQLEAKDDAK
jgi:hypothetical protein